MRARTLRYYTLTYIRYTPNETHDAIIMHGYNLKEVEPRCRHFCIVNGYRFLGLKSFSSREANWIFMRNANTEKLRADVKVN